MTRIISTAILTLALGFVFACAELEPTATPWAEREACLEFNNLVDDTIAGLGPQTDAAYVQELERIADKMARGSYPRNRMHALIDMFRHDTDDARARFLFDSALKACGLAPLPTPTTKSGPRTALSLNPTAVPTPRPTATPKPTVTSKPPATPEPEASPARYCEWFIDEVSAAYRNKDDQRANRRWGQGSACSRKESRHVLGLLRDRPDHRPDSRFHRNAFRRLQGRQHDRLSHISSYGASQKC